MDRQFKHTLIVTTSVGAIFGVPVAAVVLIPDGYKDDEAPSTASAAPNYADATLAYFGTTLFCVCVFALLPRAIQWLLARS